MKKLLCLALLFGAQTVFADPPPYGATFDKPYKKAPEKDGTVYIYEHGNPTQSQIVVVFNKQQSLKELRASTLKTMPPNLGHFEEKQIRLAKHPAIMWEGINHDGIPYSVVMVNVPGHSVVCGSATYDLARNRDFVQSLKLP
jgi:hypothetical protein